MRRDSRKVLAFGLWFLAGATCVAAPQEVAAERRGAGPGPVRLTIEVNWGPSGTGAIPNPGDEAIPTASLELSAGRVLEAIPWPPSGRPAERPGWGPLEGGAWRLGDEASGRARARIEAPLDATIVVRRGGQAVSIPVVAVLDRPQQTPATAPMTVGVERLAWDAMAVNLGPPAGEGIVAPGAEVPVSVGLNILWPEATEVAVRYSAMLRPAGGGDVVARQDAQEVLATNRPEPALRAMALRAPSAEGVYTLEVQATWEPVVREGSRLGRLIRRRKPLAAATSSVRRMSLVVLDPRPAPAPSDNPRRAREGRRAEAEVDSVDLSRSRIHRPIASGRSPLAEAGRPAWAVPPDAILAASHHDRLRDWFQRPEAEAGRLEAADSAGLAWSAVGLKAAHPDRPHRLTLTVAQGEPAALGVAMIEAGESGTAPPRPRVLLDACASGPPVLEQGPPQTFSWLVWPGSAESVVVLVNRNPDAAVRVGTLTLTELDELPAAPAIREPDAPAHRALGIYLEGPHALDRFGGDAGTADAWTTATNLAAYLATCGATAAVVPESLSDRPNRRALDGQAEEDTTRPDRLDVLRGVLERRGGSLWTELSFEGTAALPGLPPPDSPEAFRRGLVRLDGRGRPVDSAYHPLHPDIREAMKRRVAEALARHRPANPGGRPVSGLVIRLGPGPTLLGTPDTGIDDATFDRFVRETFSAETAREVPGRGTDDPDRFDARLKYLAGAGRMPWLTWRTRAMTTLYAELGAAAQEAAPGAVLALVTPGLDGGPAGSEARRVDLAGLTPGQAWRSVGLDLTSWPGGPAAPAVLRGVSLSNDALAHDLATSPDLDSIVASRQRRGLLLTVDGPAPPARIPGGIPSPQVPGAAPPAEAPQAGPSIWLSALPLGDGTSADEPLGHALAALDAQWVFLAATAVAGHEERLRRFAAVFRVLPAGPASPAGPSDDPRALPFGTAVRTTGDDTQTFLSIANDSPYPIRIACLIQAPGDALIEDLGRGFRLAPTAEAGGRNIVLDLLPFGVSAIRVAAPRVRVASLTEYPSEAVLAGMQARSNELSQLLARLNQGPAEVPTEPANPGFEPGPDPTRTPPPSPAATKDDELPPLPGASDPAVTTAGGTGPGAAPAEPRPRGWHLEAGRSGNVPASPMGDVSSPALAIDGENPHAGRGSLRLSAPSAPASVVSEPFVPSVLSNLTIRAYFRSSPPDATVRVWIEGESGGRPYIRRSELSIPGIWEARAVRASDLPQGGLDSARLRFELMTPGMLWLDDLRIGGDGAGKSIRLNAQRTMLAALQAYRERRYADFARLAASHWVKQSAGLTARLVRSGERPTKPGQAADAPASALSSERRLR